MKQQKVARCTGRGIGRAAGGMVQTGRELLLGKATSKEI